mmetsp:Transcript_20502/g.36439  ORF Transcript_20502/g.36439 Transcript_20502/m.36439 type:complete len:421 (-) Transcript_20502:179-1441(-)
MASIRVVVNEYGWYLATGAAIAYITWKALTQDKKDSVGLRKKQEDMIRDRRFQRFNTTNRFLGSASDANTDSKAASRRRRFPYASVAPSSSSSTQPAPASDAKEFLRRLKEKVPYCPAFIPDIFASAVAISRAQGRPVFTYLHAPTGDSTEEFVEKVLGTEEVAEYLTQNFVCWAGCLRDYRGSEGWDLAKQIGFGSSGESAIAVLGALEGRGRDNYAVRLVAARSATFQSPGQMLQWAIAQQEKWANLKNERQKNLTSAQVIREQNTEYEQALAEDEAQLRQENLMAVEKAREAKRKEDEQLRKMEEKRLIEERFKALPAEPAQGPGVANVRLLFPDGKTRKSRRFRIEAPTSELFEFVRAHEVFDRTGNFIGPENLRVVTRFPRRTIKCSSEEKLSSAGVSGDCVLCVEEEFKSESSP